MLQRICTKCMNRQGKSLKQITLWETNDTKRPALKMLSLQFCNHIAYIQESVRSAMRLSSNCKRGILSLLILSSSVRNCPSNHNQWSICRFLCVIKSRLVMSRPELLTRAQPLRSSIVSCCRQVRRSRLSSLTVRLQADRSSLRTLGKSWAIWGMSQSAGSTSNIHKSSSLLQVLQVSRMRATWMRPSCTH